MLDNDTPQAGELLAEHMRAGRGDNMINESHHFDLVLWPESDPLRTDLIHNKT